MSLLSIQRLSKNRRTPFSSTGNHEQSDGRKHEGPLAGCQKSIPGIAISMKISSRGTNLLPQGVRGKQHPGLAGRPALL